MSYYHTNCFLFFFDKFPGVDYKCGLWIGTLYDSNKKKMDFPHILALESAYVNFFLFVNIFLGGDWSDKLNNITYKFNLVCIEE